MRYVICVGLVLGKTVEKHKAVTQNDRPHVKQVYRPSSIRDANRDLDNHDGNAEDNAL